MVLCLSNLLCCPGEEGDGGDPRSGRHWLQLLGRPRGLLFASHDPDGPRDSQHGALIFYGELAAGAANCAEQQQAA